MQLKQKLETANIQSPAIVLIQNLCAGTLMAMDSEYVNDDERNIALEVVSNILSKLKDFENSKTKLLEARDFVVTESLNHPGKYFWNMGAALNIIISHYETQHALKADIEKGVDIAFTHLKELNRNLQGTLKNDAPNKPAVGHSKRKIGMFLTEKEGKPYLPSASKKGHSDKEKINTSKRNRNTLS